LHADVVLGQQNGAHATESAWLVLAQPEGFRRLVAGQGDVADEAEQLGPAARLVLDRSTLCLGALVVPQQGVAKDAATRVQKNAAVHLAGKPDAPHIAGGRAAAAQHAARRGAGRRPPVVGPLFRPAGTGKQAGMGGAGGGPHPAAGLQ
jgi:hypothetical protein